MWRNWRGIAGGLAATCLGLPVAIVVGAGAALLLGGFGFLGGLFGGQPPVPGPVRELPLLGSALDSFLPLSSGLVGGLVGALAGLVLGFLGTVLLFGGFWFADDPVTGFGSFLGIVALDLLIGAAYTGYRVVFEPWLLRAGGARRMSRRERELILPIVRDCAARMGLENHPPVLVDDRPAPRAVAYPRHLVINRGLLAEFDYQPEVIAAVMSHTLVHWRNGDPVSAAFVRGVALPLYLLHGWAGWAVQRANHPLVGLLAAVLFWPVLLTVNHVIMPLQAVEVRRGEFRADQGAVLAGHRDGLRRVLAQLPGSFETGRNGWAAAVSAGHPPNELRLERLEEPGRRYPLPEPERSGAPEPEPPGASAPAGAQVPESAGSRAPQGQTAMTGQPDPREVFLQYRPRRWRRKAVLAAAAVALLAIAGVYAVRVTLTSPESIVNAYFAALAERDLAAALRATAPEVAEPVGRDLVSEAVLDSPDYLPPGQVEVAGVRVDGRSAVAEVAFTVDGQRQRVPLRLRRDRGIGDTVFHRWLVIDGFGSIQLRTAPEHVTVNGQPLPAYDAQGPRILPALPGGYQVGVPEGDPLWQPRAIPARVGPQRATEVDVPLVPHPEVRAEVDRQLVRLLDRCADSAELEPPGCPFGYGVAGSAQDVRWRIVSYPNIGLSPGPDLDRPVAMVQAATEGVAMVTGTRRFVGQFEDTVPIPVSGVVRVTGGTVVFQPGW